MRRLLLQFAVLILAATAAQAQNIKDSSIMLSAAHDLGLSKITVTWTTTDAQSFQINRKLLTNNSWGTALATLAGSATSFTDTSARPGVAYEYRILKLKGNRVRAIGYVAAGMNLPLNHYRKNILIIVDSATFNGIDSTHWNNLKNDYYMDGYGTNMMIAGPAETPVQIKARIKAWNAVNRSLNMQCLLIGRIAVPYSGTMLANTVDLPPDAHPDHGGAWPTDLYYAEMDGDWTDNATMLTNVTRTANMNNPGDGKFDQHFIPDDIDIQIGRIDFTNLPAQGSSDISLVKQYLIKLHRYKTAAVTVPDKAFISDNFGYLGGEMPMRSGWNNASVLVGKNNIRNSGNYFDSTRANAYLWANGMGGGSFTNCSGVGNSTQYKDSILAVFNVMFGSYFGDFNTTDNFLRSCLASKGLTLTNVWAHRPHWYFHQMGLGMQIGHSVITAQNNESDFSLQTNYIGSFSGSYLDRRISMNLLGDPALRLKYPSMPSALTATKINGNTDVSLSWTASPEPGILGYHVYRTNKKGYIYSPLTGSPITATTFTDTDPYNGDNYYIVKAVRMELSNTASYQNSSLGIMAVASGVLGSNTAISELSRKPVMVYPNPGQNTITVSAEAGAEIRIFDLNGRLVLQTQMETDEYHFNAAEWARGLYIVQYSLEGSVQSLKLLIQ